ncbi:MAG: calcium-binding protein [Pleurocapsa sp. MO_226.B13]|nr:calcium-binding protein [Pleurocapsa sp. MO_226.B13]
MTSNKFGREDLDTMSSVIDVIEMPAFDGDGLEIVGTDGFNALNGTDNDDFIDARGAGDLIDAGRGDDLIDAGQGGDFIRGAKGNDTIFGSGGKDVIFGDRGMDVISSGEGNDVIFGGKGGDLIYSGDGDDTVFGGKGSDTINGGVGNDVLFGDLGEDVFEFAAEELDPRFINRVGDFEVGEDSLVIKGLSSDDEVAFDPTTGNLSVNGNAVINLKNLTNTGDMNMDLNDDGEFEIM